MLTAPTYVLTTTLRIYVRRKKNFNARMPYPRIIVLSFKNFLGYGTTKSAKSLNLLKEEKIAIRSPRMEHFSRVNKWRNQNNTANIEITPARSSIIH